MRCVRCAADFDQVWRWCPECGRGRQPDSDVAALAADYSVEWIIDLDDVLERPVAALNGGQLSAP